MFRLARDELSQRRPEIRSDIYLLCKAPTTTSRSMVGNMLVTWIISDSVGTRIPALARSVVPVNSSTHSLITEPLVLVTSSPTPGVLPVFRDCVVFGCKIDGALLEVVITSSSPSAVNPANRAFGDSESSGKARVERRGARSEPVSGRRKRFDKVTNVGGRR